MGTNTFTLLTVTLEKTVPCLDHSCLWGGGVQPVWLPWDRQTDGEKIVCVCVCVKSRHPRGTSYPSISSGQTKHTHTQTSTGWSVYTRVCCETPRWSTLRHTHTHIWRGGVNANVFWRGGRWHTHTHTGGGGVLPVCGRAWELLE